MSSSVLAHEVRGSAPVMALEGQPDAGTMVELQRRIDSAFGDGHPLIVIDLLAVQCMSAAAVSRPKRLG